MKKYLVLSLIVGFMLTGCGNSEPKQAKAGKVMAKKNQYVQQGMQQLAQSDVEGAIQSFDDAIRHDPKNSANYVILGQVYLKLKNLPKAVDTLRAATRVDSANGNIYYLLAFAEGANGDREKAIETAKKSVILFMKNKDQDKLEKAKILLKSLMDSTETIMPEDDEEVKVEETYTY